MITVIPVPAVTKPIAKVSAKVSASVPVAPAPAPAPAPARLYTKQGKAATAKASKAAAKEALLRSLQDAYTAKFKLKLYMDSLAATSQLK